MLNGTKKSEELQQAAQQQIYPASESPPRDQISLSDDSWLPPPELRFFISSSPQMWCSTLGTRERERASCSGAPALAE
ncbi:hypothetical protein VZT92_012400 [Zoarces viviparus]|uniref:Uncharacterized protein n=1 Tax=Zoarces viviparus TaxID=48416 RepID=A0AAW1F894_ZOAVI